jgi:hypothetical protein
VHVSAKGLGARGRVTGKEAGGLGVEHATPIRQPDGQGEVVESDDRLHPQLAAEGDHAGVMAERREVELAGMGLDPCPLHGEPLGRVPHGGEQRQVRAVTVEMVDGDRCRITALDAPGLVPLHARPIVPESTLDLVGSARGSEQEALRDEERAIGRGTLSAAAPGVGRCPVVGARASVDHRSGG